MAAKKHKMRILDRTGDTIVAWAPGVESEEAEAKATFDSMVGQTHTMFAVPAKGAKPEQIREFKSTLPEIIAVPRYQGG